MQRGVRDGADGVVVLHAQRPHRHRDFDEEERGDHEGDVREDVEPERRVRALDGRAVRGEEGVGEVGEDARRVYQDLEVEGVSG